MSQRLKNVKLTLTTTGSFGLIVQNDVCLPTFEVTYEPSCARYLKLLK